MKNLLLASLASLAFLGALGLQAPVAHAMDFSCKNLDTSAPLPVGTSCIQNSVPGICDVAGTCQPPAGYVAPAPSVSPASAQGGGNPIVVDPKDEQYGYVMQKIMSLFAWLVGAAALTLDYSVYYTVVSMGGYVSQLTAIGTTWRILRDLGNIMLIFGFLAIGITTILNVDWYGGGKKMLPMLLVAAVFLNFSLFFAEAVIDVGNLFATQFYTQINGGHMPTSDFLNKVTISNEGISNKLMGVLGMQSMYSDVNKDKNILTGSNPWLIGFMGILLFIVTAFVLFSLAFVLIARFIILIFLLVLAPIGFAGLAIPQMQRRAKMWWDKLFEQTITAPILLLMLYVALAVITDAQFLTGFNSSAAATTGAWTGFVDNKNLGGFAGLLLSFMVAMGLLIAVVIQTKSLSAFGASLATKTAGKLTFGLTATAMRSTAGWGLQRASQGFAKTRLARAPIIGRGIASTLNKGATASYDIRGASFNGANVLKSLPGGGVDAGAAQKGGFREWEKGKTKEREDYAKTLKQTSAEEKQQKVEEGRKEVMERTVGDIEKQNKEEMGALRAKHATETNKTREQKDKEIEDLKKVHNDLLSVQQEEVKVRQQKVEELKRAPQEGYAKGLEAYIDQRKGGFLRGAVNLINPQRNAKAAEKIRSEAKKSKSEKDFDVLKEALKKIGEEKKPEEKKSEAPAPEPKPEAPK